MLRILSASLLAALLAGGNAWAQRVLEPIESSYEVPLANVVMPSSTADTVIFTPCSGCDTTSLSVNASTTYFVDAKQYGFADFIRSVKKIADNGEENRTAVYIRYSVKDPHNITRLEVAVLGG